MNAHSVLCRCWVCWSSVDNHEKQPSMGAPVPPSPYPTPILDRHCAGLHSNGPPRR